MPYGKPSGIITTYELWQFLMKKTARHLRWKQTYMESGIVCLEIDLPTPDVGHQEWSNQRKLGWHSRSWLEFEAATGLNSVRSIFCSVGMSVHVPRYRNLDAWHGRHHQRSLGHPKSHAFSRRSAHSIHARMAAVASTEFEALGGPREAGAAPWNSVSVQGWSSSTSAE